MTTDDERYGQSYIGGQDVCGSKCNTDPFDEKDKPDPWQAMKKRIDAIVEKNRREQHLNSSHAVEKVGIVAKKDDTNGSGQWP